MRSRTLLVAAWLFAQACNGRAPDLGLPEAGTLPITPTDGSTLPIGGEAGVKSEAGVGSEAGIKTDGGGAGDGGVAPDAGITLPDAGDGCPSQPPYAGTYCASSKPCDWKSCDGFVAASCDGSVWNKHYLPGACLDADFMGCTDGAPCLAHTSCTVFVNGCMLSYACNAYSWFEYQSQTCGLP